MQTRSLSNRRPVVVVSHRVERLLLEAQLVLILSLLKRNIAPFKARNLPDLLLHRRLLLWINLKLSVIGFRVHSIRQFLHIRLQLLQQHKAESNQRFRFHLSHVVALFDLVNVQVNVILLLQYAWVLLNERLDKLSQQ